MMPSGFVNTRSIDEPDLQVLKIAQDRSRAGQGRFEGGKEALQTMNRQIMEGLHKEVVAGLHKQDSAHSTEPASSSELDYVHHDRWSKYNKWKLEQDEQVDTDDLTVDLMKIVEGRAREASRSPSINYTGMSEPPSNHEEDKGKLATIPASRKAALRYLEEDALGDHQHGMTNEGPGSSLQLEETVLRRQHGRQGMVDVQPGAYSASFGEQYERLEKVENCGKSLGVHTLLPQGVDCG